ncbi:MAG: sulfotransferase [Pseudomonadota bacterium]
MPLPNFITIGAQKSGTTWLHNRLASHPDVFMTEQKELDHFKGNPEELTEAGGLNRYLAHFDGSEGNKIRGESSPNYFWNAVIPNPNEQLAVRVNIPAHVKSLAGNDIRFALLLRHPTARTISAYFHHYRMGRIGKNETVLDSLRRSLGILDISQYERQWPIWQKHYSREHFFVAPFERVGAEPQKLLEEIEVWLGLSPSDKSAIKPRSKEDNRGSQTKLDEHGITIRDPETALLSNKVGRELMREHPPRISFEEIAQIDALFATTKRFVRETFGFTGWEAPYDPATYIASSL